MSLSDLNKQYILFYSQTESVQLETISGAGGGRRRRKPYYRPRARSLVW